MIVLGMAIHAALAFVACFAAPLAMESNIWPIAGVFWSVFAVPVAMLAGAIVGWLVKRLPVVVAISTLIATALSVAIVTGIIIANNR